MDVPEAFSQRRAATLTLLRGATYAFVLTMPFSVFYGFGAPVDLNVFALYAQRGIYLSDLPLALLLALPLVAEIDWRRGPWLITGALAAMCALAFLSISGALSPSFTFYVAVRWLLAFFLYIWFLQPATPQRTLVLVFAGGLGVHAAIGILQVAVQAPLDLPGELALSPELPGAAVVVLNGVRWLRAYGLAFHPNVLGGFLAVALLLLTPWLERRPVVALWWLLWTGLWLTFSRSAWLAVGLTMPIAIMSALWKRPHMRPLLALAISGALGLFLGFLLVANEAVRYRLSPIANRLPALSNELPDTELEAFSLSERAQLNELAWDLIAERPLNGIGAGNFPLAMPRFRPLMRAQSVHNVPLLLASEIGVAGAALWLVVSVAVAARLILYWRRSSPAALCAHCAWLALVIISLFDSYPWSLNSGLLLGAMVLGLAARAPTAANKHLA